MKISLIAAMSENRVIGNKGQLPWRLPPDLKRFKQLTLGKPVIMGRKTFQSIGKPLPGRRNIVVSRSGFSGEGIEVFSSLDLVFKKITDEVFVIGGGEIYSQALTKADQIYLTLIHKNIDGDAWFPEVTTEFELIAKEDYKQEKPELLNYSYLTYQRFKKV